MSATFPPCKAGDGIAGLNPAVSIRPTHRDTPAIPSPALHGTNKKEPTAHGPRAKERSTYRATPDRSLCVAPARHFVGGDVAAQRAAACRPGGRRIYLAFGRGMTSGVHRADTARLTGADIQIESGTHSPLLSRIICVHPWRRRPAISDQPSERVPPHPSWPMAHPFRATNGRGFICRLPILIPSFRRFDVSTFPPPPPGPSSLADSFVRSGFLFLSMSICVHLWFLHLLCVLCVSVLSPLLRAQISRRAQGWSELSKVKPPTRSSKQS